MKDNYSLNDIKRRGTLDIIFDMLNETIRLEEQKQKENRSIKIGKTKIMQSSNLSFEQIDKKYFPLCLKNGFLRVKENGDAYVTQIGYDFINYYKNLKELCDNNSQMNLIRLDTQLTKVK